jgi:uncharacterized protein
MLRDDSADPGRRRAAARNVLGETLDLCSIKPTTGFYRDGCCNTGEEDLGSHTVCAVMTPEFLEYSKSRGNDLSTPQQELGFPGLKPGDRWCLCAPRWQEALEASQALSTVSTHERWHQTLKNRILLENYYLPGDLEAQIDAFVAYYNHRRYHESIDNLTPADVYFGRSQTILLERERIKRKTIQNRRLLHHKQAA